MKSIENKEFIFVLFGVVFLILIFGISSNIKKSPSDCKKIINKIKKDKFIGVILFNERISHYRLIKVNTNNGIIEISGLCPKFGEKANVGDSVKKLRNTNIIKLKKKANNFWSQYKYKFVPYECGNLHPCDLDN